MVVVLLLLWKSPDNGVDSLLRNTGFLMQSIGLLMRLLDSISHAKV